MTDTSDVERLNRIRAALQTEFEYLDARSQDVRSGWETCSLNAQKLAIRRALEIVERVWESLYSGKSEDRGA